jgi:cold shock CspA family protein
MNVADVLPNFPLQITLRNVKATRQIELWIRVEAAKLETFYKRIMGCRVTVERLQSHAQGSPYHVRIDLVVPGGKFVIRHEPTLKTQARQYGETEIRKHLEPHTQHKSLRTALKDAFSAAARRLQDYARRQRGDVKSRELLPTALVKELFPDKGYGFLATTDGREIYFHKDSVLSQGFSQLKIGTRVTFAEEPGDNGPQASTVRISRRLARQAAA